MNNRLTAAALFLLFAGLAAAQNNPFFSGSGSAAETEAPPAPGLFQAVGEGVAGLQRDMNARLSELSRLVNEERNVGVFFVLLALAFVYGTVHALGPGHGKVIMASYALAHPLRAKQGVLLGAGVAVIHTLSAVLLVTVLYLVLQSSYRAYGGAPKMIITLISYALITCLGVFLLIKSLVQLRRPIETDPSDAESAVAGSGKTRELIVPALLMGLVPCEGAVLILVFSLSINAYWLGISLSAAMSVGMAVTISAVGLAALGVKQGSVKLLSKRKQFIRRGTVILQLTGAAVILAFGALMFFSTVM
jgi:nickel/cobalt exporter